jgi:hypothetical protein
METDVINSDSKLLSGFPFIDHRNTDNNLEIILYYEIRSPSLDFILSQFSPVDSSQSISLVFILMFYSHLGASLEIF